MAAKPKAKETEISVIEIDRGEAAFCIIGGTSLIFNRMSAKAKRQLLLPSGRMNEAERSTKLKHDPEAEYRDSVYRNPGDQPPTRLKFPAAAFKGAMETAALDSPGSKKTEVGRRVFMPDDNVDLYGVPRLLMSVVRSADMARTPDIRTRAIVSEWACIVRVGFAVPLVTVKAISRLLATGGIVSGVGDWRQEKGSGNHGTYRICNHDDPDFQRIIATGGRAAQDAALDKYQCYDEETEELLVWYLEEILRRGREKPQSNPAVEGNPDAPDDLDLPLPSDMAILASADTKHRAVEDGRRRQRNGKA
jgi:hypothetical protein